LDIRHSAPAPDQVNDDSKKLSPASTWLLAIRPKTLWASVAPVMMGLALAYGEGSIHWLAALATLTGALLIQIGTNFSNDYSDFQKGADTKERQGPMRVTQAGLVSPAGMLRATFLVFVLAGLVSAYLVVVAGWPIALIGVVAVLSGILYTAGPFPLGYLGLGDLFVFVFFGPVAVGGTYFIQRGTVTWPVLIAGLAPGLLSVAILVVNNLRDIEGDRAAGKKTLAVRFGPLFARMEYLFCILISAAVPLVLIVWLGWYHPAALASLILIAGALPAIRKVFKHTDGKVLNPVLGATARLLLIYTLVFSVAWVMSS
jgi:1,4-dihydroxy-2-naphthoate octaprenyltransferase